MRRTSSSSIFFVSVVGLAFVLASCALFTDLTGYSDPPKKKDAGDSGASSSGDGGVKPFAPDGEDGGTSPDGAPVCSPSVTIDETFAGGLGEFTPIAAVPDYPKHGTFDGKPAALLLPMAYEDGGVPFSNYQGIWAGIWRLKEVPLVAFEIEVEVFLGCPVVDQCGDGFAIAWTATQSAEGIKAKAEEGGGFGIPMGVGGGAVAGDLFLNEDLGDKVDTSLQILQLRGNEPGFYNWVAAAKENFDHTEAWRKYKVSLKNGTVTLSYELAANVISANLAPAIDKGIIGITTGTGFLVNGVAVRNFKGRFYNCTP